MKPKLERVEIEAAGRGNHDLAVDDAAGRQPGEQRGVELGKVPIQRPQITALDEDVGIPAKNNCAKSVPFGLVQESSTGRKLLGELREHRFDRRRDGKSRVQWISGSVYSKSYKCFPSTIVMAIFPASPVS